MTTDNEQIFFFPSSSSGARKTREKKHVRARARKSARTFSRVYFASYSTAYEKENCY